MADVVEVKGMNELLQRMESFPNVANSMLKTGMDSSLLALNENVIRYPPEPADSTYRRTATLGRSLGSSMGGGKSGEASIYQVKKLGSGYEGKFGTNLDYAEYVIGSSQSAIHRGRWWTLRNVAEKAQSKILQIWQSVADKMARYLDGKGLL